MNLKIATALIATSFALPAFAQEGDAEAGERQFRQCQSCHNIVDDAGEVIAGRANVRTGPNLYGIDGRVKGSVEDFRYSPLMAAAGEDGMVWDQEGFVAYVQDPTGYLQEVTGESGRGSMSFRVRSAEDAADLWAYLVSVGPES